MVYLLAERVFILEHYFASKSFSAVREGCSNYKEVQNKSIPTGNKISGHSKCLPVTSAHRATKQLKLLPYRFQAVRHLQQGDAAAGIQYWCCFSRFVREWVHV
jgi:hypothetical protein